jgi:hypothetical protein
LIGFSVFDGSVREIARSTAMSGRNQPGSIRQPTLALALGSSHPFISKTDSLKDNASAAPASLQLMIQKNGKTIALSFLFR